MIYVGLYDEICCLLSIPEFQEFNNTITYLQTKDMGSSMSQFVIEESGEIFEWLDGKKTKLDDLDGVVIAGACGAIREITFEKDYIRIEMLNIRDHSYEEFMLSFNGGTLESIRRYRCATIVDVFPHIQKNLIKKQLI